MAITRAQQAKQMLQNGGMLVSPSKDGKRPGYRSAKTERSKQGSRADPRDVGFSAAQAAANVGKASTAGQTGRKDPRQFTDTPRERGIERSRQDAQRRADLKNLINKQQEEKEQEKYETLIIGDSNIPGVGGAVIDLFKRPRQFTLDKNVDYFRGLRQRRQDDKFFDSQRYSNDAQGYKNYMADRQAGIIDAAGNRIVGGDDDDDPFIPIIPQDSMTMDQATQDVAEETEVEDPFRLARRFRADGGIMNADVIGGEYDFESARQMYGLGKLVKKVTRTVKKIAKSPIGKAALLYAGGTFLGGLQGFGGAGFGKGTFLSNLRSGQGIANLKSYLGGKLFTSATTKPGTASTGLLSKLFSPEAAIIGSSIVSGLTADQEDEAQLLADNTGIDINEARNQILKAAAGQDNFRARAFKAGGGLMRLGYSEGDLSQSKVYQKWVERYEKNPESPLVTMHENFEKYKTFYESSKNQKAGGGLMRLGYQEGSKEPVAKKTMPLLDMGGMEKDYREDGGFVPIGRMEKADDVPARLSKNEFVFTADAVRNAGEGDIDKGAEVMYNMMKNLEAGGEVSEESQGLEGARRMFQTSQRLEEVL